MAANQESWEATVWPPVAQFTTECTIINIGDKNVRITHRMPGSKTHMNRVVPNDAIYFLEGSAGKNGKISFQTRERRLIKPMKFTNVCIDKQDERVTRFTGLNSRNEKVNIMVATSLVDFEEKVEAVEAKPAKKKKK